MAREQHGIEPVYDARSRILILGSFPSVKSRETQFFYGHPQNRFWRVLAAVTGQEAPGSIPEKKEFLLQNRIALWDVIKSCEIEGSSDSSIRDVEPNDVGRILEAADIRQIYANGGTAYRLYQRYLYPVTGREAVRLPSTSQKMRIGMGYDVHRLTEGRDLILGGVRIPYEKGLLGHSDADVLLHAIMDAMLGAAALGDIGKHFPDTDPAYKGISSIKLLEHVGELLKKEGYAVGNIDATIIAQRPKMAPHIPAMRENVARALGIEESQINIKATTEEGLAV